MPDVTVPTASPARLRAELAALRAELAALRAAYSAMAESVRWHLEEIGGLPAAAPGLVKVLETYDAMTKGDARDR